MKESGINIYVHHSAVSKEERERAEARFSRLHNTCIICTSTLELGIEIGGLIKQGLQIVISILKKNFHTQRSGVCPRKRSVIDRFK